MTPRAGGRTSDFGSLDVERVRTEHFQAYLLSTVTHLMVQSAPADGDLETLLSTFPFFREYLADIPTENWSDAEGWFRWLLAFETRHEQVHLPLRELRGALSSGTSEQAGHASVQLLLASGIQEEDPRFGLLFDAMQGTSGQQRPTLGLLSAWWHDASNTQDGRYLLQRLRGFGLIRVDNPSSPRTCWSLQVHSQIWDALRGQPLFASGVDIRQVAPHQLGDFETLVVPVRVRQELESAVELLRTGYALQLLLEGPPQVGRATAFGAIAKALGKGLLLISAPSLSGYRRDPGNGLVEMPVPQSVPVEHWLHGHALGVLLGALPVFRIDSGFGESVSVAPSPWVLPWGLTAPSDVSVALNGETASLRIGIPAPDVEERKRLWRVSLQAARSRAPAANVVACTEETLEVIARQHRLMGGTIARLAPSALARARLTDDTSGPAALDDVSLRPLGPQHVAVALRQLQRQELSGFAARLPADVDANTLALPRSTLQELDDLQTRCEYREHLASMGGAAFGGHKSVGVRALFQGPSGTGKTLAARVLGARLNKDVYCVDLAATVSKFIGDTNKHLQGLFRAAESHDVILLLDEGDSLLGQRTSVQTAVDRYANLETNFLLQRLESYDGIVVVTTNAADRIDSAFTRRMDSIITFRLPDPPTRHKLWHQHLPETHRVAPAHLQEIATRCDLTGGQIRNVVLHALLLASSSQSAIDDAILGKAVRGEYDRAGRVCPLRSVSSNNSLQD